jgi:hypothetical protein
MLSLSGLDNFFSGILAGIPIFFYIAVPLAVISFWWPSDHWFDKYCQSIQIFFVYSCLMLLMLFVMATRWYEARGKVSDARQLQSHQVLIDLLDESTRTRKETPVSLEIHEIDGEKIYTIREKKAGE